MNPTRCTQCRRAIGLRDRCHFNTKLGLVICERCAKAAADPVNDEIDRIEAAAVERVRDRSCG